MSPQIHACVLCGYIVSDEDGPDYPWTALFRILYRVGDRVAVTGIGIFNGYDEPFLEAPLDFDECWDTSDSRVPIGVIRQPPFDGRYGFPFHDACWSLLELALFPRPIPQNRLYDVCRSLPYPAQVDGVTWGHDFGGLISVDRASHPWEDRFIDLELAFAKHNPYIIPEIQRLPHKTPTLPDITKIISKGTDIFAKIPLEIITSISLHLSTVDYFNTRLALRSFYPVFYIQRFWASRFLPNADRSWVFESQKWETKSDWLWLYRRTANGSPMMKNRARVWRLIEKVKTILHAEWIEPITNSIADVADVADVANMRWLTAAGNLRPGDLRPGDLRLGTHRLEERFRGGCRKFHERQIYIPPGELSYLAFSYIHLQDTTYITGIRFILTQDRVIRLGYMTDEERILHFEYLTGFNVAVGSRGIHGIQCIASDKRESPWVGCPNNVPITSRLRFDSPITRIKAAFDGYKMVSMAALACIHPGQDDLRDSAYWYPGIPKTGLNLNEDGFTARESAITRYDPICWTMFGGMYLGFLTGISVTGNYGCLQAIEFHYNSQDVPMECRKIGKCTPSDYAKSMHFEIDGPDGEVIDSLTVYVRQSPSPGAWYFNSGVLQSLKVSTNRGNSYHFASKPHTTTRRKTSVESITLVTKSTIHGMYWTQHENRIFALGAISEIS